MALQEKSRVGHINIKGSGFSAREAFLWVWEAEYLVLYYPSVSCCLRLSNLGSHIDVPRERSQGKWIGKVLTLIVRSLRSVEWHAQDPSPRTKHCVSIFGITFIKGDRAYWDTGKKKHFQDLHSALPFYNILGCSIFIDYANLLVRFISYVSLSS